VGGTKITISGVVLANGKPLRNIQIVAQAHNTNTATTTKNDGSYALQIPVGSSFSMSAAFLGPYTIPITADGPANGSFTSVQANQVQNFTAAQFTTVYLLHGIGQGHAGMEGLWRKLTGATGLDTSRFLVDFSFDYSECTTAGSGCSSNCSISAGAQKLAAMLAASPFNGTNPGWDAVLVGFSMGGLVARDLLVNGRSATYGNVLAAQGKVRGLVTLGTPNWGYPLIPTDIGEMCPSLTMQMQGVVYSSGPSAAPTGPSSYLKGLNQSWTAASYGGFWLAASGRMCSNNERDFPGPHIMYSKCLEPNGVFANDGVVCADSAEYNWQSGLPGAPTLVSPDPSHNYSHTDAALGLGTALIMGCPTWGRGLLSDPSLGEDPFLKIVQVISGN
jgi:pimeloyl-ACP methyl ester carboxylesterase